MNYRKLFSESAQQNSCVSEERLEVEGTETDDFKLIVSNGEGDGAQGQAAQGGCGVSFSGDIPGPSGHLPGQPALGNLPWQGG